MIKSTAPEITAVNFLSPCLPCDGRYTHQCSVAPSIHQDQHLFSFNTPIKFRAVGHFMKMTTRLKIFIANFARIYEGDPEEETTRGILGNRQKQFYLVFHCFGLQIPTGIRVAENIFHILQSPDHLFNLSADKMCAIVTHRRLLNAFHYFIFYCFKIELSFTGRQQQFPLITRYGTLLPYQPRFYCLQRHPVEEVAWDSFLSTSAG